MMSRSLDCQRIVRALVVAALAALCYNARLSAQVTLRIGVIDQPDGAMLAGARLAAAQVNQSGGIVGADGIAYQLEVVDTPPDFMDIAIANMRQASVIAVLGPAADYAIARNMALLEGLDAPVFTPAAGDAALLSRIGGLVFRSRAKDSVRYAALADYLVHTSGVSNVVTVQLDVASTASLIALANELGSHLPRPANLRYDQARPDLEQMAASLAQSAPDAVAIFGPPQRAAEAYNALRAASFSGDVIYDQALDPRFGELVPAATKPGIVSAMTWSYTLDDAASSEFTLSYARAYGRLPDALSAAGYDSVRMLVRAAASGGGMAEALAAIEEHNGVQGPLSATAARLGEISRNVVVARLNAYGAPMVAARFSEGERVVGRVAAIASAAETSAPTATPFPTATPTGYHLIIKSAYQNIRSGPGLEYEVIGQALRGSQFRVLGATADYSWLVIDYRGQWGWLAGYLVDAFGNRNLVPIIQPPATTTPAPTATMPPPREPDLVVERVEPVRITLGQPAVVNVTVRNQGLSGAGNFAIAGTFQPGGRYAGVNQPGLAGGQQATVQLWPMVDGPSGPQSVVIVVDLNQEVNEGAAGEANNQNYTYRYIADRAELTSGKRAFPPGPIDLDGDGRPEFSWTGNDLAPVDGASMWLMNHFGALDEAHYDAISLSQAIANALNVDQLRNATLGIYTADGHRGVMRIEQATRNGALTLAFRIYR